MTIVTATQDVMDVVMVKPETHVLLHLEQQGGPEHAIVTAPLGAIAINELMFVHQTEGGELFGFPSIYGGVYRVVGMERRHGRS